MKSHEGQQDLPGLTGLRGIAALVVFLAHNRYQDLLPGVSKGALWLEWHDLAVDLFFMLSGLVMAHVYAGKLKFSSAESWRSYAVARIARILPLYLVTTLAALAIYCLGSLWLGKWPAYLSAQVIVTNVLLLQNWPGLFCLSVNLPAWSLSVEMFCYALGIIPALLLHRYVRPRPVLAWGAIVILVACRLALSSDTTGWGSLGRGLIGFSIGAVIPPPWL
ncbi:MAG: acyltransferase [Verrucomicrobiaceae bacterium]|nr:acyltransferase [Verrucomicrobiaceae bacterium]